MDYCLSFDKDHTIFFFHPCTIQIKLVLFQLLKNEYIKANMFLDAYAIQIRFINSNSKVNKPTCMHVLQMNWNEKKLMLTSLYKIYRSY
jgi:hypothetical protein